MDENQFLTAVKDQNKSEGFEHSSKMTSQI